MAILAALRHLTAYRYDRPVTLSPQTIRLRPAPHSRTPIAAYSLTIKPEGHFLNWQQDPFGNWLARVVFPEKVTEFSIEVDVLAEMAVFNPFDFFLEPAAEKAPFPYAADLARDLAPYLAIAPAGPLLTAYVAGLDRTPRPTVDFLVALNAQVQRDISYIVRLEPGVQTPDETLELRRGSCRDSAWLLVQICRHLGLAARFVSGYLIQLAPDLKALDGPSGTAVDFTDLHAWAEVFLPGAGWVGLDATSGLLTGEGHIPLAATPDFQTAAPVTGGVEQCEVKFEFAMEVRRAHETPRVTKPYAEEQWTAVLALGETVERRLQEGDVRLTMGGEPTFVSIDDPDGEEWNTGAVGPTKRKLAEQLLARLAARRGQGGFVHYGMGKWYPGEQLPRWALTAWWRKDGLPLWRDPQWLAGLEDDLGHGPAEAERFIRALGVRLGVGDRYVLPAHEDIGYHLWREGKLPSNVDPSDARLADPLERGRLARVFNAGLGTVKGYVLPLQKRVRTGVQVWATTPWYLRDDRVLLIPGDSPVGLRLPLDSLPWVAPTDAAVIEPADPLAPRGPLPGAPAPAPSSPLLPPPPAAKPKSGRPAWMGPALPPVPSPETWPVAPGRGFFQPVSQPPPPVPAVADKVPAAPVVEPTAPALGESAREVVRTALCVEPRDGKLFIFFPPVSTAEDYLELLAAVEATAAETKLPVVLEGYAPPFDPRLDSLKITPDPGVIEVNIDPSSSWRQLVEKTESLYEDARLTRLGTEKFLVDGRHVGTGGGNHVVLGGTTPADSPFLRRPDVLGSLLAYWQRHPSLSYVFSGLFIGPTSQAPRMDEARQDIVYEVELALQELAKSGPNPPAWRVDRIFRDLLTDVTGNTHRAEFCVDKLYSPDGPTGRLGLLELRAFEMPPHARMSLVQQLLVRALVAWFWKEPFRPSRLVRWGTALHDRWMLPYFAGQDLDEICADLKRAGLDFDRRWLDPHWEFRFPSYGRIQHEGVTLELRLALEPWPVLGEQGAAAGTVRYVDSSVERLQVQVSGYAPETHAVLVNGRRVPLVPTEQSGVAVAGVRYRAWQPPNCLHPTIEPHAPLRFEIVDVNTGRSLGACTYHAGHPGGRNYVTNPINSYEAESRRLSRFEPVGMTPGRQGPVPAEVRSTEFPYTLDLRREG